jgi:hypothetical protein
METLEKIEKEMNQRFKGEAKEGKVATEIEKVTGKIPSDFYLYAAFASMAGSLAFKIAQKNHLALFVGQWAAPFLLFGVYNKLVKLLGHGESK